MKSGCDKKLQGYAYDLARLEEMKWQQRSSVHWLKLGDNNTKYFHVIASSKYKVNLIKELQMDLGNITDPTTIALYFSLHYKNIIGCQTPTQAMDLRHLVNPT